MTQKGEWLWALKDREEFQLILGFPARKTEGLWDVPEPRQGCCKQGAV